MILVFDVGNSNIVAGVLKEGKLINHWRLRTDNMRTSDEYGMHMMSLFKYHHLDMADIKAVVISSVVPSLNIELEGMSETYFHCKPLVVGPGVKTGLALKYENPREVGADRVVNAVAAYHKYGCLLYTSLPWCWAAAGSPTSTSRNSAPDPLTIMLSTICYLTNMPIILIMPYSAMGKILRSSTSGWTSIPLIAI